MDEIMNIHIALYAAPYMSKNELSERLNLMSCNSTPVRSRTAEFAIKWNDEKMYTGIYKWEVRENG